MERIVCSLYADKRRLIRLVFSFITCVSYNADFYSILYVNVLKRRFNVLLTAWVTIPMPKIFLFFRYLLQQHAYFASQLFDIRDATVPENHQCTVFYDNHHHYIPFDIVYSDELEIQNTGSTLVPGKWYKCGGVIPFMSTLSNIVLQRRRTRNICSLNQVFKKNDFVLSRLMKNKFCLSLILPKISILPVTPFNRFCVRKVHGK